MDNDKRNEIIETIRANRDKFLRYNNSKTANLYSSITDQRTIDLFEAIPFLLGYNLHGLPGYVQPDKMPLGLHGFQLGERGAAFIQAHFPSAPLNPQKPEAPFVQMFALMGSGGTIAYTAHSDFDFWVCADERGMDPESLRLFRGKCRAIENWIEEKFNIEVHFFLNDINKVKSNIFDDDSEENFSGTSLGELLKEEFFRSSIVVSGKIPFWWMVPAGSNDAVYEEWLGVARDTHLAGEFVDLGNLFTIPREDFLVSALFQLLKSLGNPFKSIIKLGLLERYIHSTGTNPFISNIIKKNVHEGKLGIQNIDSYVIMFNHVFNYYNSIVNDANATDLLNICFYLKVDPRLSRFLDGGEKAELSEKTRIMQAYTKKWNWSESMIRQMDEFENQDIDSVNRLMSDTKKYVLRGYRDILNAIETNKITHKLSGDDLKGITRKIHSHFSMSADKIDNSLSFKGFPQEKLLTVEFVRDRDGREFWLLSKRIIVKNYPAKVIFHKDETFIGIIVWISMNRIFQKDYTRLEIQSGIHAVDPNYIRDLVTELSVHFAFKRLQIQNSYFVRDPFPIINYIIINPYSKYSKKIDDIIFLYHNSWGETRFETYKSEVDIARIATAVLNGALVTRHDYERALRLSSSQPYGSSRDFDRINSLLRGMHALFVEDRTPARKRYVTMLGNTWFVFSNRKTMAAETVVATPFDAEAKMLFGLGANTGALARYGFDPMIPELNYLRKIAENRGEDVIKIYFQKTAKYCNFFVSDERGAIHFFRKGLDSFNEYLARLCVFSENTAKSVSARNPSSPLAERLKRVEVYRLEQDARNNCTLTEMNPELDRGVIEARSHLVALRLVLHPQPNGEVGYSFSLPGGACTNVFTRANIFQVAGELQLLRRHHGGYSHFVTEVDLSNIVTKAFTLFTSFSFTQKNAFEMLIERALQSVRR